MDRLTKYSEECRVLADECGGLDRLHELAEADRAGRLVVLPCKVGDIVWKICYRLNGKHKIEERPFSLTYFELNEFGKSFFLTREEAEAALEAKRDGSTSM